MRHAPELAGALFVVWCGVVQIVESASEFEDTQQAIYTMAPVSAVPLLLRSLPGLLFFADVCT